MASILDEGPSGGLNEALPGDASGQSYPMILRLGEIERFEEKHGGILEKFDALKFGRRVMTARMALDVLALGLVGGGMSPEQAATVLPSRPRDLLAVHNLAALLIVSALAPDLRDALDDDVDADDDEDSEGDAPEKPIGDG